MLNQRLKGGRVKREFGENCNCDGSLSCLSFISQSLLAACRRQPPTVSTPAPKQLSYTGEISQAHEFYFGFKAASLKRELGTSEILPYWFRIFTSPLSEMSVSHLPLPPRAPPASPADHGLPSLADTSGQRAYLPRLLSPSCHFFPEAQLPTGTLILLSPEILTSPTSLSPP